MDSGDKSKKKIGQVHFTKMTKAETKSQRKNSVILVIIYTW